MTVWLFASSASAFLASIVALPVISMMPPMEPERRSRTGTPMRMGGRGAPTVPGGVEGGPNGVDGGAKGLPDSDGGEEDGGGNPPGGAGVGEMGGPPSGKTAITYMLARHIYLFGKSSGNPSPFEYVRALVVTARQALQILQCVVGGIAINVMYRMPGRYVSPVLLPDVAVQRDAGLTGSLVPVVAVFTGAGEPQAVVLHALRNAAAKLAARAGTELSLPLRETPSRCLECRAARCTVDDHRYLARVRCAPLTHRHFLRYTVHLNGAGFTLRASGLRNPPVEVPPSCCNAAY